MSISIENHIISKRVEMLLVVEHIRRSYRSFSYFTVLFATAIRKNFDSIYKGIWRITPHYRLQNCYVTCPFLITPCYCTQAL